MSENIYCLTCGERVWGEDDLPNAAPDLFGEVFNQTTVKAEHRELTHGGQPIRWAYAGPGETVVLRAQRIDQWMVGQDVTSDEWDGEYRTITGFMILGDQGVVATFDYNLERSAYLSSLHRREIPTRASLPSTDSPTYRADMVDAGRGELLR